MTNRDREALQEHIMSLIPETIDTEAGTHIYLLYQERLKIAEAIATGFIKPIEYCNLSIKEFVDNIFGELESVMRIIKYPRIVSTGNVCGCTIMHEDYETIKKKYRDMIRGEVNDGKA